MNVTYSYECPRCGTENPCEVEIGEQEVDYPNACEGCGLVFNDLQTNKLVTDALEWAQGKLTDDANDRNR